MENEERKAARENLKTFYKQKRKEYYERAKNHHQKYVQDNLKIREEIRKAKKEGNFYVPPEAKVALLIRIKGINALHPKVKKVLQLFRLRQVHNAVLVKLNKASISMIHLIEPYITYGYPTLETIEKLVYKRGFLKINSQRIPIENNKQIESVLGHLNIICV